MARGGLIGTMGTLAIGGLIVLSISEGREPGSSAPIVSSGVTAGQNGMWAISDLARTAIAAGKPVATDAVAAGREAFGPMLAPQAATTTDGGTAAQSPPADATKKG